MSDASPGQLHKDRLEALSDGVFAVVMTLLVLDLKTDHLPEHATEAEVWAVLREMRRPFAGYVFSFLVIGIFWVLQDRKFALLAHTTARHAALTLAFLFGVTLMPFSVSVYLRSMQSSASELVYFGNLAFIATMLFAGWIDARRSGLIASSADPTAVSLFSRRIKVMGLAMWAGVITSYFQPPLAPLAVMLVALAARRWIKQ